MAKSEEDRLRRDHKLMKQLNIVHKPELLPSDLPVYLEATFRNLLLLGKTNYEEYEEDNVAEGRLPLWRKNTKERAREMSETASRLIHENSSEQTWRLKLEPLADAAFRHNIECPTCRGRLWRSELEVCTESDGPITASLEERRGERTPCKCRSSKYSGLNLLFSDKADEFIVYNPRLLPGPGPPELPKRKPDRVYGLRQTPNFSQRLSTPVTLLREFAKAETLKAISEVSASEAGDLLVEDILQAAPLNSIGDPLLFPFLVIEAKSEEGRGFHSCGIQTALPLWALLKLQDRLQTLTRPMSELGGPLVWYIAYRGDDWRVSAFCGTSSDSTSSCQIIDLWSGRVSSHNGALQFLLIMDYIFDWARDLYRPSIYRRLESLSNADFDDDASLAPDSDIFSSRKRPHDDMASEADSNISFDQIPELSADDEELLAPWKEYDVRHPRSVARKDVLCFRSASVVQCAFQCLYITRDNIRTLLASYGANPSSHKNMARTALALLKTSPLRMTERALRQMEDAWTGSPRFNNTSLSTQSLVVNIAFQTSISDEWDLKKTITCFAVAEDALDIIRELSALKRKSAILVGIESTAPILDDVALQRVLGEFRGRSTADNMVCALSNLLEQLGIRIERPVSKKKSQHDDYYGKYLAPQKSGKSVKTATRNDPDSVEQPEISINALLYSRNSILSKLVMGVYKRHRQPGTLQPDSYPYLRFSSRFETQTSAYQGIRVPQECKGMVPWKLPTSEHRAIGRPGLYKGKVRSNDDLRFLLLRDECRNRTHLCIYFIDDTSEAPPGYDLLCVLRRCISEAAFITLDRNVVFRIDEKNEISITNHFSGPDWILPVTKNAAKSWYRELKGTLPEDDRADLEDVSDDEEEQVIERFSDTPFSATQQMKYRKKRLEKEAYQKHQVKEGKKAKKKDKKARRSAPVPPVETTRSSSIAGDNESEKEEEEEGQLAYSKEFDIASILSQAAGDTLTEDQMERLIRLGYFG